MNIRRIVSTVAFAIIASGLASAATIGYTSNIVSQNTDFGYNLNLPKFNLAGQTLTGVTLYFYVREDISNMNLTSTAGTVQSFDIQVKSSPAFNQNNTATAADVYSNVPSFGAGLSIDLFDTLGGGAVKPNGIGGIAQITLGGSPQAGICPVNTPSANCNSVAYSNFSVSDLDAQFGYNTGIGVQGLTGVIKTGTSIANYVGAGNFTLGGSTKGFTTFSGGGNNLVLTLDSLATLQVEVDYTYTASGAPEPASMFLMGSALVGLGFLRKRFKK